MQGIDSQRCRNHLPRLVSFRSLHGNTPPRNCVPTRLEILTWVQKSGRPEESVLHEHTLHGAHGANLSLTTRQAAAKIPILFSKQRNPAAKSKYWDVVWWEGDEMRTDIIHRDKAAYVHIVVLELRTSLVPS